MANKPMSDDIISELTKKMLSYFNTKDTNKKNAKKRVTKAQKEALSGASDKRKKRLAKQQKNVKGQGQSKTKDSTFGNVGNALTRVRVGAKDQSIRLTRGQGKAVPSKDNLEARKKALAKKSLSIIKKDTNIKTDKNKKTKAPIVTKEQLKKSGLSLRDYMNFLKSQKTGRTITRDSRFDKKKKAKGANT